MRKILSLVLVLSLVLGSFGFAFAAPKDVEGTDYENAVARLEALEILSGFPDGTFRPDETVTRAQFAKIMAHALGVGEAAQYANGETKFADVPADHWASGYINVAADTKVINGYGDGNFGPEDQVTYAQAVTMIVRALGYEPKATSMGGYPGGYLAVAAEQDITEDISVVNTLAATRGDVALMVDASLDVPNMVQKTWGQYPEYEEDKDKTLLTTKLDVDEFEEVIVEETPETDSSLDDNEVKIGGEKYVVLDSELNFDKLLGLEVTIWADGDDLINLEVDSDEDDILFDSIVGDNTDKKKAYLKVDDDEYDWAEDARIFINFSEKKEEDVKDQMYGYFVLNDDDEVAYANLFEFDEVSHGVVYEADDDEYKYAQTDAGTSDIELSSYEDGIHLYNEKFEKIAEDDIAVGSAIFAWENSDELYMVVKNKTVEGKLEKVKRDEEIEVADEKIDVGVLGVAYSDDEFDEFEEYNKDDDLESLLDEDVVVVLDLNDEMMFIYGGSEVTSATLYGIVTYGEVGSDGKATVFTKDGEDVKYEFEKRSEANSLHYDRNGEDGLDYYGTTDDDLSFAVIEYEINSDGEIAEEENNSKIVKFNNGSIEIDGSAVESLTKDADEELVKIDNQKYYIDEDTVFMTAIDSKELDPSVIDYKDIYESKIESDNNVVFITDEDNSKDLKLVVFLNEDFSGADDDVFYGVVTEGPAKNSNKDYVVTIDTVTKDGNEVKEDLVIKSGEREEFAVGSVVAYKYNTKDEIEHVNDADDVEYGSYDVVKLNVDEDWLEIGPNGNKAEIRIDNDAVVWEFDIFKDDDGNFDGIDEKDKSISSSKIEDYNFIRYATNSSGKLVAAVVFEIEDAEPGETSGGNVEEGTVTYINNDNIAVDNIVYTFDSSSVLYNAAGTVAATGGAAINVLLDNGDVLEDVVVKDGVVKSLKFTRDISAEADAVDALIAAFTLTGTEAQVTEAREAYDALTDEGKALVNEAGTDVDDIILGEDTLAAAAFDALVDDFATPDATQAEVTAARNAYDALSAQGKTLVTKLATLQTEEAKLAADAVEAEIDALPAEAEITLADKDDIEAARASYNDLTAVEAAQVANVATLTTAEGAIADLETAQGDVDTALDSLDVAAIFTAPDQIELPADTLTETYAIEFSALPDDVTDGSIAGAGTAGSAATVNKDSAVDYTFDVTVTITAVDDAAGATAVDETTVTATKVFTVTVPYTVAPITVEAQ